MRLESRAGKNDKGNYAVQDEKILEESDSGEKFSGREEEEERLSGLEIG
jgi:hypothetical protein